MNPIAKILKPIAPNWAERFDNLGDQPIYEMRCELGNPRACIVGEVWNNTDDYIEQCEECTLYGNRIFDRFLYCYDDSKEIIKDDPYYTRHLELEILNFKKHFNTEHKEVKTE